MAPSPEVDIAQALAETLRDECREAQKWSAYYEGRQPLAYLPAELLHELGDRIRKVVINWPELVVDSLEERLDVEGFRIAGGDTDARLWGFWQDNDLDESSQVAHLEALIAGRSFVIVGAGDDRPVVITVESAEQVTVDVDPRTRRVRSALKAWKDGDVAHATLYLPNSTHYLMGNAAFLDGQWDEYDRDEHDMGAVPVVPLVNRPRLLSPGRSELESVAPLADAANKTATDMMVAAEFHAMPRRWVVGMGPDDFTDAEGRPLSQWSKVAGRVWAAEDPNAKMGQFPEAQLSNFHQTIDTLAQLVASIAGLPPHYLGMSSDNPASADAIRSAESRLVKRAERRQRAFGGSWEQVMRLASRIETGTWDESLVRLETIWRDASTPTVAQAADAAVKLHTEGITTTRQTREDLGYTQEQIARMEAEEVAEVGRMVAGDLTLVADEAV